MQQFFWLKYCNDFSAKNGNLFAYNMFEIFNVSLTNSVVCFEQLGPGVFWGFFLHIQIRVYTVCTWLKLARPVASDN